MCVCVWWARLSSRGGTRVNWQGRAEEGWARQTELVLRSTGREIHTRKLDGICTHIRMPRSVAHVPVRQNKHEPCQSQPSDVSGGGASLLYVWSQREFCPKITAYMGTGVRGVGCGVCKLGWGGIGLGVGRAIVHFVLVSCFASNCGFRFAFCLQFPPPPPPPTPAPSPVWAFFLGLTQHQHRTTCGASVWIRLWARVRVRVLVFNFGAFGFCNVIIRRFDLALNAIAKCQSQWRKPRRRDEKGEKQSRSKCGSRGTQTDWQTEVQVRCRLNCYKAVIASHSSGLCKSLMCFCLLYVNMIYILNSLIYILSIFDLYNTCINRLQL